MDLKTPDALELQKDKYTNYFLSCKPNGVFNSKLKLLYNTFLRRRTFSEYIIGIKFDKDPLAIEQNSYFNKIVNVFFVYDLDAWSRNTTNNFKFENFLLEGTNRVKSNNKEKYVYSGYGITFDSAGSWSFGNDFARNDITFGADNNSLSHSGNRMNNFLILGKGP